MKKYIAILIAAILVIGSLSGCGSESAKASAKGKTKIVTTIFPIYDWVVNVMGDKAGDAEITMLLDNGVDLHSFQPTAADILKIANCDLFIYVGGESDEWVEDALKEAVNKDMKVINLLETLGDKVKEEEMVEGMQESEHHHDEDEDHDHEDADHEHEDHDHEHEEEEGPEYDEHVWLSLKDASFITEKIGETISEIDPANASFYKGNAKAYTDKLAVLDKEYAQVVSEGSKDTVLFGDRFPFRYMTDDYNLNYYAAFVGCSAETEASFETVTFLAGKVDELGLKAILTIEGPDHRIAETIRDNTASKDQQILTLDSMQSVTSKNVQDGTTYYGIMSNNLEVLKQALN
ncbi:MAG: metal ABC transporter substrate-binding protein [Lachnospiraceae bacterium]|nr:metal ABC transporter substrate-binding protein [Lachnospiraceae bacterium]